MELKVGEKYLTLMVGDMKIPLFPAKTKDGATYYSTNVRVFVNEKKEKKENSPPNETKQINL